MWKMLVNRFGIFYSSAAVQFTIETWDTAAKMEEGGNMQSIPFEFTAFY